MDYRYPVKGCGVWLPYGFKLRNNVLNLMRRLLDETGHEETLFPLMITSDMVKKEAIHVKSFEDQLFWVTKAGDRKLDEELALRPTSETAIYPMMQLWIRSHADLPKRVYQVVNTFRYETKATRPLIRVREISTFKEAHTFHATFEEAERQVEEAVRIYSQFFDSLAIPYVVSKRPEWDKFPGALYSIAYDTVLPDGKVLQIGTVHNLAQNFSKAFDITFENAEGLREYVWQTCYGISERVIAALIAVHGDDKGLILPPGVAPIQAVVIPIPYKSKEAAVTEKSREIKKVLEKAGVRVWLDERDKLTPGSKFYEWELKGVPLRIEIGPRDLEFRNLTLVRRDTMEKFQVPEEEAASRVLETFSEIQSSLSRKASEWLRQRIHQAGNPEEAVALFREKQGIVEVGWCSKERCGLTWEEETGLQVLGIAWGETSLNGGVCPICGEKVGRVLRLGKPY